MKFILALGVVLTVSVVLSNAYCSTGYLSFDKVSRTRGCKTKETMHKIGTEWTEDCMDCSCSKSGLRCCSTAFAPVFNTDECESVFDEKTCSYKVTKKDNPSETCEITGKVG